MDHDQTTAAVAKYYTIDSLSKRVEDALIAAGKGDGTLSAADLAPIDQFHSRGRVATEELARLAGVASGMRVLDLGGGIGGAARYLASKLDCDVTVIDLTEEYCRAGEMLTERTGLSHLVHFRAGDALHPPFPDGSFDMVWTQHASMNIADKAGLYAAAHRMLASGGRFALHDVMAGDVQPIHYPAPWSPTPETSFLIPPDDAHRLLIEAGFREIAWKDSTDESREWFEQRPTTPTAQNPLSLRILLGDSLGAAFANMLRNLQEGRIRVMMGVFEKP